MRFGSMNGGTVPVMIWMIEVGETRTFAAAWYCGPRSCLKTLTETIPSSTRRMIKESDRRIAALRASAPPEVIGVWDVLLGCGVGRARALIPYPRSAQTV